MIRCLLHYNCFQLEVTFITKLSKSKLVSDLDKSMVDTSGHDHTWTQEVVEWSVSTVGKWSPPDQDQTLNIQSYNDHLSPGYQNIHTNLGSQNQNQILYHIITGKSQILIHLQRSFVVKLDIGSLTLGSYLLGQFSDCC